MQIERERYERSHNSRHDCGTQDAAERMIRHSARAAPSWVASVELSAPCYSFSGPKWPQQANSCVTKRQIKHVCIYARVCGRVAELVSFTAPLHPHKLQISAAHRKAVCSDNNALHFSAEGSTWNPEAAADTTNYG